MSANPTGAAYGVRDNKDPAAAATAAASRARTHRAARGTTVYGLAIQRAKRDRLEP